MHSSFRTMVCEGTWNNATCICSHAFVAQQLKSAGRATASCPLAPDACTTNVPRGGAQCGTHLNDQRARRQTLVHQRRRAARRAGSAAAAPAQLRRLRLQVRAAAPPLVRQPEAMQVQVVDAARRARRAVQLGPRAGQRAQCGARAQVQAVGSAQRRRRAVQRRPQARCSEPGAARGSGAAAAGPAAPVERRVVEAKLLGRAGRVLRQQRPPGAQQGFDCAHRPGAVWPARSKATSW